ncbi:hypothetical protein TWF281_004825 [Arthrobotrys megalospora]
MDCEKGLNYGPIFLGEEPLPRFHPGSTRTTCPNSQDCFNGHYYLITADHIAGARFPDDQDYHSKHQTYLKDQINRKRLWVWFTATAIYALYAIHYGVDPESPCRPSLHDGTESPTIADKHPSLILELRPKDFAWCVGVVISILLSVSVLWKADAVLEEAVDMRKRRKIHGLPAWPIEVSGWSKLWIESWGTNLVCFLVTLGITVVWSWSVYMKVEREQGCRILLL